MKSIIGNIVAVECVEMVLSIYNLGNRIIV